MTILWLGDFKAALALVPPTHDVGRDFFLNALDSHLGYLCNVLKLINGADRIRWMGEAKRNFEAYYVAWGEAFAARKQW